MMRTLALAVVLVAFVSISASASPAEGGSIGGWVDEGARAGRVDVGIEAGNSGTEQSVAIERVCKDRGEVIPCITPDGHWRTSRGCYVQPALQQDLINTGLEPGKDVYVMRCTTRSGRSSLFTQYSPDPAPPPPNPEMLARRAVDSMQLKPIDMGVFPRTVEENPEAMAVIGLNTWLWAKKPKANTWGPISATASLDGYSVTATAGVRHVIWDMGDGGSVKCGKGQPWRRTWPNAPSPNCNYVYEIPNLYTVTATSHWLVRWEGIGEKGSFPLEVSDTRTLDVGELQVVNVPTKKRPVEPPRQR